MSGIGFLFPGQGAQKVGMGRELAETLPQARQLLDRANELLGYDLARICFDGPEEGLNATEHAQPALFVCSMMALERLRQTAPDVIGKCHIAAGLSLGEYSALCFAGALSFDDGIRLVRRRGLAMQRAAEAKAGGMVAVLSMEPPAIEALCQQARIPGGVLEIANLLCPGNTVCSGDQVSCEKLSTLVATAGGKSVPLAVAGAFHTTLMEEAVRDLAGALDEVEIRPPRVPVVSNVDAQPHTEPVEIRDLLVRQVVSPVRWEDSIRTMLDLGTASFYEIGTGTVLRGLMKRIDRKFPVENIG